MEEKIILFSIFFLKRNCFFECSKRYSRGLIRQFARISVIPHDIRVNSLPYATSKKEARMTLTHSLFGSTLLKSHARFLIKVHDSCIQRADHPCERRAHTVHEASWVGGRSRAGTRKIFSSHSIGPRVC